MSPQSRYLFVYGFLMSSNRIKARLQVPPMSVKPMGQGYLYGSLYLVDPFPGMVYDQKRRKKTYGEVYLIQENNHFFIKMDHYEESLPGYTLDPSYRRMIRPVHLKNGKSIPCWVYEYIKSTDGLIPINSGKFIDDELMIKQNLKRNTC